MNLTVFASAAGALAVGLGAGIVLAQQQAQPIIPRPYYVGNPVGLPIAPPAPTDQNPNPGNPWVAATDNVKMFGAMYNVESCSYDPVRAVIVAPSRGVAQSIRTNDSWISFINHDGSVQTPRWVGIQNSGDQRNNMTTPLVLNEPLGSDIMNGVLYLADRNGGTPDPANPGQNLPQTAAIAMFSMDSGESVGRWDFDVPGFNDIEVAEDGTVYATVSGNMGLIYKISPEGQISVFVPTGDPLNSPNGIAFDPDGNIVNVGGGDTVFTWSPAGVLLNTEHAAQPGNDGLVIMPDGTKFISSVQNGGISMIRPGEAAVLIAERIPSAASMCYDAGANQLVVPMNPNNGLSFVSLNGIWSP